MILPKNSGGDELNQLVTQLYLFPIRIQFCHHLTTSYAAHKALDKAYDALNDLKDEIVEKSIGYTGNKFNTISLSPISGFNESMPMNVAKEGIQFSKKLRDWADRNDYQDVCNLADSYSGVFAQLVYLLNLH